MGKTSIQEAALDYMNSHECNFYAEDNNVTLYIGPTAVDVETIWHSDKENKIYLHVGCKEFEGDIDIDSLSDDNQQRMMEAFGIDTKRDKMWQEVTQYVSLANEHLEQEGVKAQIHIEAYQVGPNYQVYVLYDGEDVDVKDDDVKSEDAVKVVEKVWASLVQTYCDDADDYSETVRLHRVDGDTHRGESNLIYSFADCPLFFVHTNGNIEGVDGDIDRFIDAKGYFAVNADDYHEAMRQVYLHENGIER
jgi:hypothetical protein